MNLKQSLGLLTRQMARPNLLITCLPAIPACHWAIGALHNQQATAELLVVPQLSEHRVFSRPSRLGAAVQVAAAAALAVPLV